MMLAAGPRAERPLPGHSLRDGGEAEGAFEVAVRACNQRQAADAPDGAERIAQSAKGRQRLAPVALRRGRVAHLQLDVGDALQVPRGERPFAGRAAVRDALCQHLPRLGKVALLGRQDRGLVLDLDCKPSVAGLLEQGQRLVVHASRRVELVACLAVWRAARFIARARGAPWTAGRSRSSRSTFNARAWSL